MPPQSKSAAAASIAAAAALAAAAVLAVSARLFSVLKYESVIHEFDPYFNARVTKFFADTDVYRLWDWFDDKTWYPLGRVVGGTFYPGLIWTAGFMYRALHALNLPVAVQEVCVFTAPLFSALTALSTFALVREVKGRGAGLVAAALVSVVPSYVSRSVAGSFDNEGVAIFALVTVFWLYVKTLKTGSLAWATALSLSYLYMVASWGGYTFIINLLPIHCLACVVTGRLTPRLYVAYAPLIVIGTLEAASIPVVGFNAVLMSEHFGAFLAFGVLHAALGARAARALLPPRAAAQALRIALTAAAVGGAAALVALIAYVAASPTFGWTGRSLSLLDPTYASKYIPIIASVSEHQPTVWANYFTDLHLAALLAPAGLIACFRPLDDAALFLVLYGVTSAYFSGVMIRLMLVLAPAACCLGAIGASDALTTLTGSIKGWAAARASGGGSGSTAARPVSATVAAPPTSSSRAAAARKASSKASSRGASTGGFFAGWLAPGGARKGLPIDVAITASIALFAMLAAYAFHSVYVAAEMYSSPSIVMQTRGADGSVHVFDDFREAYAWLRHNTPADAKVASWWDYGYQTTAMADRAVIVDNNTWNNTHIATVGRAMASPEKKAWQIYRSLDVGYVFVVFGGYIGYPSDDVNKFLWMVRIGGGVFPDIKEADYIGDNGYSIDGAATKTMLNSLMYKLSYYGFADASEAAFGRRGYDRVRNTEIGQMDVSLTYFEEVFTSQHWLMRVYKVRDAPLREARVGRKGKKAPRASGKGVTVSGEAPEDE